MKRFLTVFSLLAGFSASAGDIRDSSPDSECLLCHLDLDEEYLEPAELFSEDVHYQKGFTCGDCHGGDPTTDDMDEAKSEAAGFIGVPPPGEIPFMCAKCHGDPVFMQVYDPAMPVDQVAKYWSSKHGKGLLEGISMWQPASRATEFMTSVPRQTRVHRSIPRMWRLPAMRATETTT